MEQAIKDSGLEEKDIATSDRHHHGFGGPSTQNLFRADIARNEAPKGFGPFMVPRCMSSSLSANIATNSKLRA